MKSYQHIRWGANFSANYARHLGIDPEAAFHELVTELRPKSLRLVAYWSDIEPARGDRNYADLDFQTRLAEQHNISYIIVVGRKVPRYPECHWAVWAKQLEEAESQQALYFYIKDVVNRYKHNHNLWYWQVENEMHTGNFGSCPPWGPKYLGAEVALVRSLSHKPILITGAGEHWDLGLSLARHGDAYATSMYRRILHRGRPVSLPVPPIWFQLRAKLIKLLRPQIKQVFISELQAEPWVKGNTADLTERDYDLTMSRDQFGRNLAAASQTGFHDVLLWGAEWWYLRKRHGDDWFWRRVEDLFSD